MDLSTKKEKFPIKPYYEKKIVEEDESAGPQSDSRQALAKFNKQMEILFKFLQAVENIKLDPSVLDPEPVEIADEKDGKVKTHAVSKGMPEGMVFCYQNCSEIRG